MRGILNPITQAPELNRIDPFFEERERARGQLVLREAPEWHLEDVCTTGANIEPKPMRLVVERMGSGVLKEYGGFTSDNERFSLDLLYENRKKEREDRDSDSLSAYMLAELGKVKVTFPARVVTTDFDFADSSGLFKPKEPEIRIPERDTGIKFTDRGVDFSAVKPEVTYYKPPKRAEVTDYSYFALQQAGLLKDTKPRKEPTWKYDVAELRIQPEPTISTSTIADIMRNRFPDYSEVKDPEPTMPSPSSFGQLPSSIFGRTTIDDYPKPEPPKINDYSYSTLQQAGLLQDTKQRKEPTWKYGRAEHQHLFDKLKDEEPTHRYNLTLDGLLDSDSAADTPKDDQSTGIRWMENPSVKRWMESAGIGAIPDIGQPISLPPNRMVTADGCIAFGYFERIVEEEARKNTAPEEKPKQVAFAVKVVAEANGNDLYYNPFDVHQIVERISKDGLPTPATKEPQPPHHSEHTTPQSLPQFLTPLFDTTLTSDGCIPYMTEPKTGAYQPTTEKSTIRLYAENAEVYPMNAKTMEVKVVKELPRDMRTPEEYLRRSLIR